MNAVNRVSLAISHPLPRFISGLDITNKNYDVISMFEEHLQKFFAMMFSFFANRFRQSSDSPIRLMLPHISWNVRNAQYVHYCAHLNHLDEYRNASTQGVRLLLSSHKTSCFVHLCKVNLNGSVVLDVDYSVTCRTFSRDVKLHVFAGFVLHIWKPSSPVRKWLNVVTLTSCICTQNLFSYRHFALGYMSSIIASSNPWNKPMYSPHRFLF